MKLPRGNNIWAKLHINVFLQIKINTVTRYIIVTLVSLYLLQMEAITSSEQPKITSPSDTKAILKHVSCYIKIVYSFS